MAKGWHFESLRHSNARRMRYAGPVYKTKPKTNYAPILKQTNLSTNRKYKTNYLGSKQKITPHIIALTPKDVNVVFDGFGGSNIVAYEYKKKGKKVYTNDKLRYSYHIARAIIENNKEKLSEHDIDILLKEDKHHPTFVQRNFKGVFFTPGILNEIDSIRYNCDKMSGYKRDIALFALAKTTIQAKPFSKFTYTKKTKGVEIRYRNLKNVRQFKKKFRDNVHEINGLVFDNGKENKAFCGDINKTLKKLKNKKIDLAYFDPPYVTQFSTVNYEKDYHFIEGLLTNWKNKKIMRKSMVKAYKINPEVTQKNIQSFFENFMSNSKHIPSVIVSYRDKANPTEKEIKKIIKKSGKKNLKIKKINHRYCVSIKYPDASNAKEYLFLGKK